jgi:3-oxoacyl-[acyl-carrier protein] reductase
MGNVVWSFADRIVVITGSAIGMGEGAVESFAEAGAAVYGLDIDVERGEAVAERTGTTFVECDITSSKTVRETFEAIGAAHGRLDVLVNNAGGFWEQNTTESLSEDEWDRVIALNLKSVFLCAQSAIPLLRKSTAGRIITIASLAGQTAMYRSSPPYAAAKAGANSLSRVLAYELASEGITSNAIAPSVVLTDRIKVVRDEAERAKTAASVPLGRYADVGELVAWMLFLASSGSGFMTGETISVNGGRFMS